MNHRHGWIDYHARMGRVSAYIHDHLADPIDLDRVAEIAHLSPYHWHRIYHSMNGETVAATVRRLRLQRASGYLANTSMPVETIARKCGYPNSQSFARAFRADYGMSPTGYRKGGDHTSFRDDAKRPMAADYPIEIRDVARVRLAGFAHRGSYMLIGKAFETAYAHVAGQGLDRPDMRWLAQFIDDPSATPESQLSSRAGLSMPDDADVRPPLQDFELGGCVCAVLRHRGPYATMRAAYEWLYGSWLIRTGCTPADQPVFEEYLNNPRDTEPNDLLTDIFLPLSPKSVTP